MFSVSSLEKWKQQSTTPGGQIRFSRAAAKKMQGEK